ncbi:MAG: NAD+ synthase [Chloroflexota bacterium]
MLAALSLNVAQERERIVAFIRAQLANAGYTRLLLGVSGGIDSALAAALCVEAAGPENVLGLLMPYRTSNPASEADGRRVIAQLGIRSDRCEISEMVDALVRRYPDMTPARMGNVMARARMIVLYDQSAAFRGLVVGTSNRTETLLGYFTVHGDGAAAFKPLAHLCKCQVRQLAAAVGVPADIVEKAPSADLWAGQTDEGELGFTYDEADQVLYLATQRGLDEVAIAAQGFSLAVVQAILRRMRQSAFKRAWPPALDPTG